MGAKMRALLVFILGLVLFIATGAALWIYESQRAASQISVEAVLIEGAELRDWDDGLIRYPKTLRLRIALIVSNPTDTTLEGRLLLSDVFVMGRRVGELVEREVRIEPGVNTLNLEVDVELSSLRGLIAVKPGPMEVELAGHVEVPVKAWGVELLSVKVPYRHKQSLLP